MKGDQLGPHAVLLLTSWIRFLMILVALLAPVSYTHLDVYKRQELRLRDRLMAGRWVLAPVV